MATSLPDQVAALVAQNEALTAAGMQIITQGPVANAAAAQAAAQVVIDAGATTVGAQVAIATDKAAAAATSASNAAATLAGALTKTEALASDGTTKLGHVQDGTGAATRTTRAKLLESISIEDFILASDTDIGLAFQRGVVAANAKKKTLHLTATPFGTLPMLTPVSFVGDIAITAEPGTVINATSAAAATLISLGGSVMGTVDLGADAARWSRTINVPAALGLSAGDQIQLTTNKTQVYPAAALALSSALVNTAATVTADAPVFSVGDVGKAIIEPASQACLKIIAYLSPTQVTAWTNNEQAPSGAVIANGAWFMNELFNTSRYYYYKGEYATVQSVSGDAVTLRDFLRDSYSAQYTAVRKLSLANVAAEGFTIARNMNDATAFAVAHARGCSLNRIKARGARAALISASNCYGLQVSNCSGSDFWYAGTSTSYGLVVNSCQDVLEDNNQFFGGRHAIAHGGREPNRNVVVRNCTARKHASANFEALDFHGNCEDVKLQGNDSEGLSYSGRDLDSKGNTYATTGSVDAVIVLAEIDSSYFKFNDTVLANSDTTDTFGLYFRAVTPNIKVGELVLDGSIKNVGISAAARISPRNAGVTGCEIGRLKLPSTSSHTGYGGQALIVTASSGAKVKVGQISIDGDLLGVNADATYIDVADGSGDCKVTGYLKTTRGAGGSAFNAISGTGLRNVLLSGATLDGDGTANRNYFGNSGDLIVTGGTRFLGFMNFDIATQAAGPSDVMLNDASRDAGLAVRVQNNNATRVYTSRTQAGKRIGYGDAAPAVGTWAVGDWFGRITKTVGQPKALACTAAGSPGTWTSEGNL